MRNILTKNAPASGDLVQDYIDTAYDNVKLVADNLDALLVLSAAITAGDLDDLLQPEDIDTLAELNAILTDAVLVDGGALGTAAYEAVEAFATAAQGATADSALQPADLDSLAKLNALVLDAVVASQAYVDAAVTGLMELKGGYNATTNTPDLTTSPNAWVKGDSWQVTDAGSFYTATLEVGDQVTVLNDDPSAESDWIIVNRNIDSTAFATAAQGGLADTALQPGEAATTGQGALADTAVQPGDNVSDLVNDVGYTDDQTGAEIKAAYENESNTNAFTDAEKSKLGGCEANSKDDQTASEIQSLYNSVVPQVSAGEKTAGTETAIRRYSPLDIADMAGTHGGGGGGGGMTALYKDANYTLQADELVYSEAGLTHTLPLTPADGTKCSVWDVSDNAGSNAITVERNGETIMGLADDFSLNMNGGRVDFLFDSTEDTWFYSYVVQTIQPDTTVVKEKRQTVWMTQMYVGPGQNPGAETYIYGTNGGGFQARAFDASSVEYMLFPWKIPENYVAASGLAFIPIWTPSTTNTGDVLFELRTRSLGEGDAIDQAPIGADILTTDTALGTAGDMQFGPQSNVYTGLVAGEITNCRFQRFANQAADTYTGDAYIIGVTLVWYEEETLTAAVSQSANNQTRIVTGTTDTLLLSDNGKEIIYTNAAPIAVTLPDGFPEGWNCVITQTTAAGVPTVTPNTDLVNGASAGVAPAAQWKGMHLGKYTSTGYIAKF